MARGSPVWYVVASLLIILAVYEMFQYTGYDRTLGPLLTALVYVFAFPVGIAAWVYQDAADRGWNGGFWALVAIFVPLGIVIYLIARRPRGFESRGGVWYAMYGIVLPLLLLGIALWTGYGNVVLVMGIFIWMGFAIAMAAPAKDAQSP
jgi:hypothetical protein